MGVLLVLPGCDEVAMTLQLRRGQAFHLRRVAEDFAGEGDFAFAAEEPMDPMGIELGYRLLMGEGSMAPHWRDLPVVLRAEMRATADDIARQRPGWRETAARALREAADVLDPRAAEEEAAG